jgi:hypothetical protein
MMVLEVHLLKHSFLHLSIANHKALKNIKDAFKESKEYGKTSYIKK